MSRNGSWPGPWATVLVRLLVLLLVLVPVGACDFPAGGQRPEGIRFITGAVAIPDEDILGRQVTGLQTAAVAVGTAEDPARVDVFPSAVFDASRVENARFTVKVADDRSFVLVLQVPSASTSGPGAMLAVLRFDDGNGQGTLLPLGAADIELGVLDVAPGPTASESSLLVGDASNPLAQVDTDADGTSDLSDADDDGDGTPDAADTDVAGDGVDDAKQVLPALPDDDADGVPDLLQG